MRGGGGRGKIGLRGKEGGRERERERERERRRRISSFLFPSLIVDAIRVAACERNI
jgi:hypothetical protein